MDRSNYLQYWEKNIQHWGSLYFEESHAFEALNAPRWFDWLYKKTIYKLEAALMKKRYQLTMDFIDSQVQPGMHFADIGCGLGLFSLAALKKGAFVHAIDFSEKALYFTQKRIQLYAKEYSHQIKYHHLNVELATLPRSDIAIAIGVTPYIQQIDAFYHNALTSTQIFYCLVVNSDHYINRLRKIVPFLNVRNLLFYSPQEINQLIKTYSFKLTERTFFATGFLDLYHHVKDA